ncbi:MAG TPA: adenylosuccinate lyase [Candidatus Caldiarchaeum subterraneum]|uniref:Adenylosuccinate lyase n=1 Tax=Caldiarchaeum subterraneum TaxID=311458 RepID=A0A832ZV62_CALS0|nr:adenylosuccinate lyase [Candidatus Caldarchaeum subterraneum]
MSDEAALRAVTPVDGRYRRQVEELSNYFSEYGLIRYRIKVELEYLKLLVRTGVISLSGEKLGVIDEVQSSFTVGDAAYVKQLEEETRHDVDAVVRFLKKRLEEQGLGEVVQHIHLGLTSEDVNNIAYSLALRDFNQLTLSPLLERLAKKLRALSKEHKLTVMLARTHGQPAVPTTLGKELAVHMHRIDRIRKILGSFIFPAKLSGAVGTYAGLREVLGEKTLEHALGFVNQLGLEPWIATKQTLPHDRLSEYLHRLTLLASALLDLSRDLWLLCMLGYVEKKRIGVGSSTMPHKVNPIEVENAEGNLEICITLLSFMAHRLMVSRLQRDLSDSTIRRNYGTAAAYLTIAIKNITSFLDNISFNREKMREDLLKSREWISEAVQIRLRLKGYDVMDEIRKLSTANGDYKENLRRFITSLGEEPDDIIPREPEDYLGVAGEVVDMLTEEE